MLAGCVRPAACAPACPPRLSPLVGVGGGQGAARLLLRCLGPCQSPRAVSSPASSPGTCHFQKKSQGLLRDTASSNCPPERRRWAGHGAVISLWPWRRGHQGQHPARWGSEIRGPDTNQQSQGCQGTGTGDFKACTFWRDTLFSTERSRPGEIPRHAPLLLETQGHLAAVSPVSCWCCGLRSRVRGWQRTVELRSKERPLLLPSASQPVART